MHINPCDFAILDEVYTTLIRRAGIAPSHRIMPRCAAAFVVEPAKNWETCLIIIEIGDHAPQFIAIQQDRIIALIDHRIPAPRKGITLPV